MMQSRGAGRFQSALPQHIVSYHPSSPVSTPSQHSAASTAAHMARMQRQFSTETAVEGGGSRYYATPPDASVLQNPINNTQQQQLQSRPATHSPPYNNTAVVNTSAHSHQYYNAQAHNITHHIPVTSHAANSALPLQQPQQSTAAVNHRWNAQQPRPLSQQQQHQRPMSAHSSLQSTHVLTKQQQQHQQQLKSKQEQPLDFDSNQDPYSKWQHFYVNQKHQLNLNRFTSQQAPPTKTDTQFTNDDALQLKAESQLRGRDMGGVANVRATERIRSATPDSMTERPSRQLPPLRPSSANAKQRNHPPPQMLSYQQGVTSEQDYAVTSDVSRADQLVDYRSANSRTPTQQTPIHRSQRKQLPVLPAAAAAVPSQSHSMMTSQGSMEATGSGRSKDRASGRSSAFNATLEKFSQISQDASAYNDPTQHPMRQQQQQLQTGSGSNIVQRSGSRLQRPRTAPAQRCNVAPQFSATTQSRNTFTITTVAMANSNNTPVAMDRHNPSLASSTTAAAFDLSRSLKDTRDVSRSCDLLQEFVSASNDSQSTFNNQRSLPKALDLSMVDRYKMTSRHHVKLLLTSLNCFCGRFSSLDVDDEEVDHVDIAKRATQMVEKLSDENQALRTEVEQAQKQLATVGRVSDQEFISIKTIHDLNLLHLACASHGCIRC